MTKESSLHLTLKNMYTNPGDQQEVAIEGYLIDVVRENLLIEIQTGNFSKIKEKITRLVDLHPIRIIYPVPQTKWIIRLPSKGNIQLSKRKSPRRGRLEHVFSELIRFPHLSAHPNFSIEVLLVQEEEIRREDGKGSWRRRGQSIVDHRLIDIVSSHLLECTKDYWKLLPQGLLNPFSNRELSESLEIPLHLATKMTYCLRAMGVLTIVGKRSRANLYSQLPH